MVLKQKNFKWYSNFKFSHNQKNASQNKNTETSLLTYETDRSGKI